MAKSIAIRAGLRPLRDFLPAVVAHLAGGIAASSVPAGAPVRTGERQGAGEPVLAKQKALARYEAALTGRHKAPSGEPARTQVRVGGEGTPSAAVQACGAGAPGARPPTWRQAPAGRPWRTPAPCPAPATRQRPFSSPRTGLSPGSEAALKTAEILPFTGSNTPYESHE